MSLPLTWILTAMSIAAFGLLLTFVDEDASRIAGMVLFGIAGMVAAVGIITAGVLLALREHSRE